MDRERYPPVVRTALPAPTAPWPNPLPSVTLSLLGEQEDVDLDFKHAGCEIRGFLCVHPPQSEHRPE